MNNSAPKIPITLVTGFLGAGKTTLLNRMLSKDEVANTLAIINEFGEIGLDHLLIETTDERIALLDNGCVCCTVRDDLIETLMEVNNKRLNGELDFDKVVLETTGLADPAPILHGLMAHEEIVEQFSIEKVITVIDAVNGVANLSAHSEAQKQLACAEHVVLTKTDLATTEQCELAKRAVSHINPLAELHITNGTEFDEALFATHIYAPNGRRKEDYVRWLGAGADAHECDEHCHHMASSHGEIKTYSFATGAPINWPLLREWLDNFAALKGANLLRIKGIVKVNDDAERPIVVHGVQHVFHQPLQLDGWPSDDKRTRIVFIVKDIDISIIEKTLRKFVGIDMNASSLMAV